MLPLLAKLADSQAALFSIEQDMQDLAASESVSARKAAAFALSNLDDNLLDTVSCTKLLLGLLQDEDLSIRQVANAAAGRLLQQEEQQSSRTVEQLWSRIAHLADPAYAYALLAEALDRVEDLLGANNGSGQDGVLFEVEKANVYIDSSVDIDGISRLLARLTSDQSGEVCLDEAKVRFDRCRDALAQRDANGETQADDEQFGSASMEEAKTWLSATSAILTET